MGIIIKILAVGFFIGFIGLISKLVMNYLKDYILENPLPVNILYFMCKLGVLDAIHIFVGFLVASWTANKIIKYLSS